MSLLTDIRHLMTKFHKTSGHTHTGAEGDAPLITASTALPLANNYIFVGQATGYASAVAMSSEASIVASGAVTLSNAAVIGKVLTGYTAGSGTISAADSILGAIQKLGYDKHVAVTVSGLTGITLTGQQLSLTAGYVIPTTTQESAWHARSHTLLSTSDHSDIGTYINQALLTTSDAVFNKLTVTYPVGVSSVINNTQNEFYFSDYTYFVKAGSPAQPILQLDEDGLHIFAIGSPFTETGRICGRNSTIMFTTGLEIPSGQDLTFRNSTNNASLIVDYDDTYLLVNGKLKPSEFYIGTSISMTDSAGAPCIAVGAAWANYPLEVTGRVAVLGATADNGASGMFFDYATTPGTGSITVNGKDNATDGLFDLIIRRKSGGTPITALSVGVAGAVTLTSAVVSGQAQVIGNLYLGTPVGPYLWNNTSVIECVGKFSVSDTITAQTLTVAGVVCNSATGLLSTQTYATLKGNLAIAQADVSGLTTASSPTFAGLNINGDTIMTGVGGHATLTIKNPEDQYVRFVNASDYSFTATYMEFRKSRNTLASPATVVTGDTLGNIKFYGHDGTNFVNTNQFYVSVNGTVSTGVVPADLHITSGNGAEAFILRNNGDLDLSAKITAVGVIKGGGYQSSDGSAGATGTATSANTLTIKNGLITNIA